jgi:hypothetical protein
VWAFDAVFLEDLMAITITIDNDRTTTGIQALIADETAGVQPTDPPTDDGNEINVTLAAGFLGGFQPAFNNLLNALPLSTTQKEFARDHDGASSSSEFVKVTVSANETINDLFFSDPTGQPLNGDRVMIDDDGDPLTAKVPLKTLDGDSIYLWTDGSFGSSGDFCVATTSDVAGAGQVVAAFYLNEDTVNHLTAQVQMVVFEPLFHFDETNADDAVNFTDLLRVSASGTQSFDFDKLQSGSSLWAAVGSSTGGVLVTGINPEIDAAGKKTNDSDVIHTSQGGQDATIGVNNQLFDNAGETAVFTLVTGFTSLLTADAGATGDYVVDVPTTNKVETAIDYGGYIPNVTGAGIFISQSQGAPVTPKSFDINVYRTNNATPEEGFGYVYSDPVTKTGDAFSDDLKVNVATVTVTNNLKQVIGTWSVSPSGTQFTNGSTHAGVTVTIGGNDGDPNNNYNIDIDGVFELYTVAWTVVAGQTMNRFSLVSESGQFDVGRVDIDRAIPGGVAVGDQLYVEDDGPALSGQNASEKVVEDELSIATGGDLSTGNSDGDGDSDEASYTNAELQVTLNGGTDVPPLFSLNLNASGVVKTVGNANLKSLGVDVEFAVDSDGVIWGMAGTRAVFKLWQSAGAGDNNPANDVFSVDLLDQVDHLNNSGDNALLSIDLTPAFQATDADGDFVDLNGSANDQKIIRLNIENDVPILSGQTSTKYVVEDELSAALADGDLSTGNPDGGLGDSDNATFNYNDFLGVVTVGGDEPIRIDMNTVFSDGVREAGVGGALVTSKGMTLTYQRVGAQTQAVATDGRIVFTVTRTQDGGTPNDSTDDVYTVDLRDQLDHANASGDNGTLTIDLAPLFIVTDFDGDRLDLNGAGNDLFPIQLVVENDVPILSGATASVRVEEDELSTSSAAPADTSNGITDIDGFTDEAVLTYAALNAVVASGADEPTAFSLALSFAANTAVRDIDGNALSSQGVAMTWAVSGGVVQAMAGTRVVFTITHNTNATPNNVTDDSFAIDLRDQIDHPNNSGDTGIETVNLTPAFVARDYDGDAVDLDGAANDQEPIQLVVENDVPALSGGTASVQVDEDELSTSSAAPADTSNGITDNDLITDEAVLTYAALNAVVTSGADDPVAFSLALSFAANTAVRDIDGNALSSQGVAMTWAVSGGVVQAMAGTRVVFTIIHNTNATPNNVTDDSFAIDLRDQIDHPSASGDAGIETVNLTPAFVARDYDGDAVDLDGAANDQEPIQLAVENDVPAITAQIEDSIVEFATNSTGTVTKSLNGAIGGDDDNATSQTAAGVKQYTITSFTEPKNVFPNLDGVLSADGTKVTYYSTSVAADQGPATAMYELVLNQAGAGTYTFTVLKPPPLQVTEIDFTDLDSGQNLFGTIALDKAKTVENGVLPGGGLLTFPWQADINDLDANDAVPSSPAESNDGTMTSDSGTTNTSKGGGPVTIGNTNQAFDATDEGAWFCYVDNPAATSVSGVGLNPTSADDADSILFDDMIHDVKKASVEIVQASGNGDRRPGPAMQIKAYDLNPGTVDSSGESRGFLLDPTSTGVQVNIIGVKIYDANKVLIEYRTNLGTGATNEGTLQDIPAANDNSGVGIVFIQASSGIYHVAVSNLKANYTIEWETAVEHNAALTQNLSGSYDIGGFNLLVGQDTPDQLFDFSVLISDYDGDSDGGAADAFANFSVGIDGTGINNDDVVAGAVPPAATLAATLSDDGAMMLATHRHDDIGSLAADYF